eukprot:TRINITY_DN4525_c0_g1_i1.p1 TRINITY_DN4525_c0_g1~~TRINITY_DN4525_c0_g1_i1.p1  ORF type:complete len:349 (+),score=60.37 TRINITY_DN4525_c0_g1_i1:159-1205(+)
MVKRNAEAELNLPPGFRFFPTDEELVVHYLAKKANLQALPVPIIAEVDLYKYDPWLLPGLALFGEKEWYFFTPRDRKYPNGSRPNRAAGSGYWKATGADKPIIAKGGKKRVGIKKALVFYAGKAPKGTKTNWIMHEYRLAELSKPAKRKGSLRLDDWVLCRIYNKKSSAEKLAMEKSSNEDSGTAQSKPVFQDFSKKGSCSIDSTCDFSVKMQNPDLFQGAVGAPRSTVQQIPSDFKVLSSSNQWANYNCCRNYVLSALQTDSSSSKPESADFVSEKEEVESSLRVEQQHLHQPPFQQPLFSFNTEGLQNPFTSVDAVSIPDSYQDFIDSLTSSDYLPKLGANDMLFQ